MKISEIRNKMFNLSDLKGLIDENVSAENINWANFFSDPRNQKFLNDKYAYTTQSQFWSDKELRDIISHYPGSQYSYLGDDAAIARLNKDTKKNIFNAYAKNRIKYIQAQQELSQQNIPVNTISSLAGTDIEPSSTKLLYDFFVQNGGQNLSYTDSLEVDEELMKNYVNACSKLSDLAFKYFADNGNPIKRFDDMGLRIGSVKEPFLLFLFFYYLKYFERRGGSWNRGTSGKIEVYLGNMEPGSVSEYAKYIVNKIIIGRFSKNLTLNKNVFDIILTSGKASLVKGKIGERLIQYGLDGEDLSYARSMAYLDKYQEVLSIPLSKDDINIISTTFKCSPFRLFDPLTKISDIQITAGLQKYCSDNTTDILNKFIKPTLVQNQEYQCPAEQIFTTVRSFRNVLNLDFGKILGTSGRNVFGGHENASPERISLLLGPANIGLAKLEEDAVRRGYSGPKIPQSINGLKEMYMGKIKKTSDVKLWELLKKDVDTKTQDEIFNYLLGISDAGTIWSQEYNRFDIEAFEQGEGGLGRKSIDILGKKKNELGGEKVLCFEYQGEQHYHPVNVKPSDYQYTLYSAMREDILTRCGFSADETGGRKYYHGYEVIDPLAAKTVIINTFKEYAQALGKLLNTQDNVANKVIGRQFNLVNEGASIKGINIKALNTFTIKEAFEYFNDISNKNPEDSGVFDNPPLKGIVPYLCSPCRFYDEVQTALDMERDRIKSSIISKRSGKSGWSMAYITPKIVDSDASSFTSEDYEYTVRLANGKAAVFQWTNTGKEEIARYLEKMGFKTLDATVETGPVQENTDSLFQQIIREIINENAQ